MCDTDDIIGMKTNMDIDQQRVDKRWQHNQSECGVMNGAVGDTVVAEYGEKYTKGDVDVQQEICVDSMKVKCSHNKRGYCLQHKIKGDRREAKHKAWEKREVWI